MCFVSVLKSIWNSWFLDVLCKCS